MKKKANRLPKSKVLMILNIMYGFSKSLKDVNLACSFAIEKEKINVSKIDLKVARGRVLTFFESIPNMETEENTVIYFIDSLIDILLKLHGNNRIRYFITIKEKVRLEIDKIDQTDEINDNVQSDNVKKLLELINA